MLKRNIIPGIIAGAALAFIATTLVKLSGISFISSSVLALVLGILLNNFRKKGDILEPGLKFSAKKILKLAIILLGASMNLGIILNVGKLTYLIMIFTLTASYGLGYIIRKKLGINWKLSSLISAAMTICGGTAIAALSPIVDAEEVDIAYSMSIVFLIDMVLIILFPLIGGILEMTDMAFGLWSGLAINDTSSVLAAGYAYSESAGDFATMVKLTRTLALIPTVVIFSIISNRLNSVKDEKSEFNIKSAIPVFIFLFIIMAALNSLGFIPVGISNTLKSISKFLMIVALASIGLNTRIKDLNKAGIKPIIYGISISTTLVIGVLIIVNILNIG